MRVSRPQASLCAGACVCVRAHHSCRSGLPASRAPAPDRRSLCAGRARSSSTLGFTTWRAVRRLIQVLRGRGAKRGELRGAACSGQGRASRARRGVRFLTFLLCDVPSGTTLSWQCSRSTTNAISELLLFCVFVCVMRYIFISVLCSLGVRGVCVRCGYEDKSPFW